MAKTDIDWCKNPNGTSGHVWNPVKGCNGPAGDGVHCPYCYACNFVKRFRFADRVACVELNYKIEKKIITRYEGGACKFLIDLRKKIKAFKPHFFEYVLAQPLRKKPTIYFFSMSDPADWEPRWYEWICRKIHFYPQHTFVVLTKRPRVYEKYQFPINTWLGITITGSNQFAKKYNYFLNIQDFINKWFISFEPLQSNVLYMSKKAGHRPHKKMLENILKPDWIIVGPETGTKKKTPGEWLDPFFSLDISVFMKNSWKKYTDKKLRQEWPEGYKE